MIGHPNLKGWYRMEGNGNDSASATTGTVSGFTFDAGRIGQKANCTGGANKAIKLSNMVFGNYGAGLFTIAGHLAFSGTGTQIIYSENDSVGNSVLQLHLGAQGAIFIRDASAVNRLYGYFDATALADGAIRHWAFVRDNLTTLKIYVDGIPQTLTYSNTGDPALAALSGIVYSTIGAIVRNDIPNGNLAINGSIDDLQMYGVALPQSDIKRIGLGLHPLTRS